MRRLKLDWLVSPPPAALRDHWPQGPWNCLSGLCPGLAKILPWGSLSGPSQWLLLSPSNCFSRPLAFGLAECCKLHAWSRWESTAVQEPAHSSYTANVDLSAGRETGLLDNTVVLGCWNQLAQWASERDPSSSGLGLISPEPGRSDVVNSIWRWHEQRGLSRRV